MTGWTPVTHQVEWGEGQDVSSDWDVTEEDNGNKPPVYLDDEGRAIYRASALGMCTTALIAVRSGFEAMRPPDSMQRRFDEGHLHETNMVQRLNTEYGIEVFNREREVTVWITPTLGIRGHIDGEGVGLLPDEREAGLFPPDLHRAIENKTMSSLAYKDWLSMTWEQRWAKYPGYAMQSTVYGVGTGLDQQLYCVKDKESGQMTVEVLDLPCYPMAKIKAKVLGIEAHVRQGQPLPESCDKRSWPCPVFYVGPCGEDKRDMLAEREGEVVLALAHTYQDAKEREIAAKKAKETARDEIKKHLPDGGKYDAPEGWKINWAKPRKTGTKSVFDEERFREEHPDLYAEYLEEKDSWSKGSLTVTPPKEKP